MQRQELNIALVKTFQNLLLYLTYKSHLIMRALFERNFVIFPPRNGTDLGFPPALRAAMHQLQGELKQCYNVGFITPLAD
jgi:hypothetical protein